jgi:hypothetical protein
MVHDRLRLANSNRNCRELRVLRSIGRLSRPFSSDFCAWICDLIINSHYPDWKRKRGTDEEGTEQLLSQGILIH